MLGRPKISDFFHMSTQNLHLIRSESMARNASTHSAVDVGDIADVDLLDALVCVSGGRMRMISWKRSVRAI